jgi:hypothetical protein
LCLLWSILEDEVLISGEDHDDDEGAGQRQVDERQKPEDHLRLGGVEGMHRDMGELEDERDQQNDQRQREAEVEGRQDPAAGKEYLFE